MGTATLIRIIFLFYFKHLLAKRKLACLASFNYKQNR
jgi:hypothetical protein